MESLRLSTLSSVRTIVYSNDAGEEDVHYITSKDKTVYVLADKGVVVLILPRTFDPNAILYIKRLPTSKYPVVIRANKSGEHNETHIEGGDENALDDEDSFIVLKQYENCWYLFC
jgi:hypothetical protein